MFVTTEPIDGTNDWHQVSKDFHSPIGCNGLIVTLRRYQSKNFDRFISDTVWVDDVRLVKVEEGQL